MADGCHVRPFYDKTKPTGLADICTSRRAVTEDVHEGTAVMTLNPMATKTKTANESLAVVVRRTDVSQEGTAIHGQSDICDSAYGLLSSIGGFERPRAL